LPGSSNHGYKPGVLTFPQLSRKPALKNHGSRLDNTLRDNYENGMESARRRFTRKRRQWEVTIDLLTEDDLFALENFVDAVQGDTNFLFPDARFPKHAPIYKVRFETVPAYTDAGIVEGEFRQNTTFTIREV
jgi:hypothetical protein